MKPSVVFLGLIILTFFSYGLRYSARQDNPQTTTEQQDPCDGPDPDISCCFKNMPATLTSTMRITNQSEAGAKLLISGTIFKADGKSPYPDIILYAFHTDSKGYYSKNGTETGVQKIHGRLHGWCKTDKNGYYEIQSIRPARYPDNTIPAHIHAFVKTSSGQIYRITEFVFKDDDLVDEKYISSLTDVGGTGVVDIRMSPDNVWTGKRDIVLR